MPEHALQDWTMISFHLSVTVNGYPVIKTESPYEAVGELLTTQDNVERARHLLHMVEFVSNNEMPYAEFPENYAGLKLTYDDMTAHVWVNYNMGFANHECRVPLDEFQNISRRWLEHVLRFPPPEPVEVAPPFEIFRDFVMVEMALHAPTRLPDTVNSVLNGETEFAEISLPGCKVVLRHYVSTAQLYDIENDPPTLQGEMPLTGFLDICLRWLDYLKRRKAESDSP